MPTNLSDVSLLSRVTLERFVGTFFFQKFFPTFEPNIFLAYAGVRIQGCVCRGAYTCDLRVHGMQGGVGVGCRVRGAQCVCPLWDIIRSRI